MKITVKLFGPAAQAAACRRELTVSVEGSPAEATCAVVRRRLAQAAPGLAGMLPACRLAVNGRYASEEQAISPGDEVAVIGMVSGG